MSVIVRMVVIVRMLVKVGVYVAATMAVNVVVRVGVFVIWVRMLRMVLAKEQSLEFLPGIT